MTWYIQVNLFRIFVPLSLGSIGQKKTVCLLLEFWPPDLNPMLMIGMKIKRTSNMVNMMEESALNYNIVLQWRINKVYVLKVLEELGDKQLLLKHQCSTDVSFSLLPPAAKHAFHRLSDQWGICRNWLWRCSLISPELNRSILFSLYLLRMNEEDGLLSSKSRAQREKSDFLVHFQSTFFHRNDARWIINRFSPLRFCFCFWSGCKNLQLWRLFFRQIFETFCVVVVWINHKFIWSMRNSDPGLRIVLTQRPDSNFNSVFTIQATGRNFQHGSNFCVSLDPSSWLWWSIISWKSVFTTGHCIKLFFSVFSHEILSNFNNTRKSCIHTKLTYSVSLWKTFDSFFISLQ